MTFRKGATAKTIDDPALASDIDKVYGLKGSGDVWVAQDERTENVVNYHPDGVHTYFFGSLTSKRYRDNYDAIFGKKDGAEQEVAHQETP